MYQSTKKSQIKKWSKIILKAFIFLDVFLILYFCAIFLLIAIIQDFEYAQSEFRYLMGFR
jgi:uncharacterized membrane protein YozB (DUF420 family)